MTFGFFSLYLALAALFYLRLTATAVENAAPEINRPSGWHRVRRQAKSFLRRGRSSSPKP